jgi:hypothetical protein
MMRTALFTLIVVLLTSASASSQNTIPIAPPDRAEVDVNVSVTTGDQYRSDLNERSFSVLVDKKSAMVESLRVNSPASVVIAFDASRSMPLTGDQGVLTLLADAVSEFGRALTSLTEYSFITFAGDVQEPIPFVRDASMLFANKVAWPKQPRTLLFDACVRSITALSTRSMPKAVLILITDGTDVGSRTTLAALRRLLIEENVLVYTVRWSFQARGTLEGYELQFMRGLPDETGGLSLQIDSARQLKDVFRRIATDLNNQYTLRVSFPAHQREDRSELQVTLHVRSDGADKKANLRYRRHVLEPVRSTSQVRLPSGQPN